MKKTASIVLMSVIITFLIPLNVITISANTTVEIGDYIQIGTYYGKPIIWRCVDFDENGPLILSDKIICMKSYDATTSENSTTGSHSRNRGASGSNYWKDSNIRSWLNSNESAGNVEWSCGNPPYDEYVHLGDNDYAYEQGFLKNFTFDELLAIKEVSQKSIVSTVDYKAGIYSTGSEMHRMRSNIEDVVQNYSVAYAEYTNDKIFLLDVKQLNNIYNNHNILGQDYHIGELTQEAIDNSDYKPWSDSKKWFYWLRTPANGITRSDVVSFVESSGRIDDVNGLACFGNYGIRPAFYLSDSAKSISGTGSYTEPYIIIGIQDTTKTIVNDSEITVNLNGKEIEFDQPPIMAEGDRVMVPIRAIFEAMGYSLEWNQSTQTAIATKNNDNIVVQVNNDLIKYSVNGVENVYKCDVVPQIISDRILVPVRAVAESAGCDVEWDATNRSVLISSNNIIIIA